MIKLNGKAVVADPCYELKSEAKGILGVLDVKAGNYAVSHTSMDNGSRIASIRVLHESVADNSDYNSDKITDKWDGADFSVGVDSGSAGVFDYEYYKNNHENENGEELSNSEKQLWYEKLDDKTFVYKRNKDYVPFSQTETYKGILADYKSKIDVFKGRHANHSEQADKRYNDIVEYFARLDEESKEKNEKSLESLNAELDKLLKTLDTLSADIKNSKNVENTVSGDLDLLVLDSYYDDCFKKMSEERHNYVYKDQTGQRYIGCANANEVDESCVVSMSGYGDGLYSCYVARNDEDEIVGILVSFEYDGEEEED